jgi:glycolate oxidase FAD binding subunit
LAQTLGGTLFIERASFSVRKEIDAWGDAGPVGALMQALKTRFDPDSLLNPGRFVSGI